MSSSRVVGAQSIRLFLQSSELALPHPLTHRRCVLPFGSGGGTHLLAGGGVGGPNSDEGTDVVLYKYMIANCKWCNCPVVEFLKKYYTIGSA
jgi:hypothetical protein